MKRVLSLVLLAACTGSSGTEIPELKSDLERNLAPNVSTSELASLVDGNTQFAADLYRRVHGEPGNLFMSPYSISTALAMTYAGASTNTAAQMASALHFTLPPAQLHAAFNKLDLELASRAADATGNTIPFRLRAANAIFGQDGMHVEQPFLDELARDYGAGLHVLDFAADPDSSRLTINGWVEDQTNDKIKDLLPDGSVTALTRMVLANAIYFSAAWDNPFEASETADRPFLTVDDANVVVPTMQQLGERPYGEGAGYRAAELPYDGDKLSMVVIVPDDLATFESTLSGPVLADVFASLGPSMLDLELPKFKFDAPLKLRPTLEALGMTDAFDDMLADFSGINGGRDLTISDVLHKGFIAIDEKGTEAAAATAVVINTDSSPEPHTLHVDKPFLVVIRDRPTGTVLFIGRVVDPR
jgi:serpin B